jgi:predicted nucleotidyltransferase
VPIDVSCGALPFEQALIDRATPIGIGSFSVRVARPEDLLVMKAIANRPRDRADIESLLRQFPEIDTAAARRTVQEFAEMLDSPELVADFDRALRERR